MRRVIVTVVLLVFPFKVATAVDQLEPCRDEFSEPSSCYMNSVRRVLLPGRTLWQTTPLVRVVALPGFEPEWTVSVVREGESAILELRLAKRKIDNAALESTKHDEDYCSTETKVVADVPVDVKAVTVNLELAAGIRKLWETALLGVGSPKDSWTSDGTMYHFSAWIEGYGLLCGRASSQSRGSSVFVNIAEKLRDLARADEEQRRDRIEAELLELLGR